MVGNLGISVDMFLMLGFNILLDDLVNSRKLELKGFVFHAHVFLVYVKA